MFSWKENGLNEIFFFEVMGRWELKTSDSMEFKEGIGVMQSSRKKNPSRI